MRSIFFYHIEILSYETDRILPVKSSLHCYSEHFLHQVPKQYFITEIYNLITLAVFLKLLEACLLCLMALAVRFDLKSV